MEEGVQMADSDGMSEVLFKIKKTFWNHADCSMSFLKKQRILLYTRKYEWERRGFTDRWYRLNLKYWDGK